jgi:hypothetical protein
MVGLAKAMRRPKSAIGWPLRVHCDRKMEVICAADLPYGSLDERVSEARRSRVADTMGGGTADWPVSHEETGGSCRFGFKSIRGADPQFHVHCTWVQGQIGDASIATFEVVASLCGPLSRC